MSEHREEFPTLVVPESPAAPAPPSVAVSLHRAALSNGAAIDAVGTRFPAVGSTFLGFRLRAVLGRGAFGVVYLAEQGDLANRFVALKVAPDILGESQTLAQLQHTNIVPIYSLHKLDGLQAVCMPYFGATTLADIVHESNVARSHPLSGRTMVETVEQRKRSTVSQLASNGGANPVAAPAPPAVGESVTAVRPRAPSALHQLERMSHVEAVLWIVERIADGLAYAHEQGILHHDLKPANVLLTEDGQPMLLDFNLSEDTKRSADAATALAGGTLPYMAPEHLEVFRNRRQKLDCRSDVYSLGVILYELLAGRMPFPVHARAPYSTLASMIEDRHKAIAPLRQANPAISPAVAALVEHCLEAEPSRRYQSARELQEDLKRHRSDLPLRYAREPSWRERTRKWVRRHPRLASSTSVGALCAAVLILLGLAFVVRGRHMAYLESEQALGQFRDEARTAHVLLYSRHGDRGQLEEGMQRCRAALTRFAVLDDGQWLDAAPACNLPAEQRDALRAEAGELLYLLARAEARHAKAFVEPDAQPERYREAQQVSLRAEAAFGRDNAPRALWEQRADLARRLGDEQQAERLQDQARRVPLRTPRDRYLAAHRLTIAGKLRDALDLLEGVTLDDPRSFSAWFVRGNCYYDLVQDTNAIACYNACVSLRPDFPWTWLNRGLAHLRLRQYRAAADNFGRVAELNPDEVEAYVNRGLARDGMKAYTEAIADYTRALSLPNGSTRVYFLRAEARRRNGDPAGAQRDFEQGLATEPTDEAGWIARGSAWRERDPRRALGDYDKALALNPDSFVALQDKAALLVDKFHDEAGSLAIMEKAVKLYPESALARGGRGVLLARAGKRDHALEDAKACLLLDAGAATHYQVACIYALTAKQHEADRLQALPLLSGALRTGFGLDFIDYDHDLDALRPMPEFTRIVTAARALNAPGR